MVFSNAATNTQTILTMTVTRTRYDDGSLECPRLIPKRYSQYGSWSVWTVTRTRYNDGSLECRDEYPNDIHNDNDSDLLQRWVSRMPATNTQTIFTIRFLVCVDSDSDSLQRWVSRMPRRIPKQSSQYGSRSVLC
jgi:hypothetical protein